MVIQKIMAIMTSSLSTLQTFEPPFTLETFRPPHIFTEQEKAQIVNKFFALDSERTRREMNIPPDFLPGKSTSAAATSSGCSNS